MVNTPVLYMTFARSEYARESWNAIKNAEPKTLYFYSNKARIDNAKEVEENEIIRSFVKEIDWDCDLHVWFREEYVDVYQSLLGAKKWIFETEKKAIFIEEDCVASSNFFNFCDYFLDYYEKDKRVGFITGNNYSDNYSHGRQDHFLCHSIHHFGWATWKDRWDMIDWNINPEDLTHSLKIIKYFKGDIWLGLYYTLLYRDLTPFILKTRCWDYVKVLNQFKMRQYAVVPKYNLVKNIGISGVHTANGRSLEFTTSNNSSLDEYPFFRSQPVKPEIAFDICESSNEGIRNKKEIIKRIFYLLKRKAKHIFYIV